ncbi:hypothetical protein DICVIV_07715 [Dictyocaulus viviparus]|uniref:Thioredoxin domain-containing protein 17 n=1 Tax=Dictyocaulus viviparus TaxID=29172 RepID=A0A0D8XV50_DICVI|nr:hypothetical protein DICVIV_07715 [Dictyocaulus viviparus]
MLEVTVNGYNELQKVISTMNGRVFILFTGSKVNGKSWCPDCVEAEPVVDSVIKDETFKSLNATFITCFVGAREYWKDPACPFRTDPSLKLTCIPTLLEMNRKHKRIVETQLKNIGIVKDFFVDDD